MRFFALIPTLLLTTLLTQAASPTLDNILPRGAQRGTEVELTFIGKQLDDTQEILIYNPGTTAKSFEVDPKQRGRLLKVVLSIAPDCPLGEHSFRVRTATGISDLMTFWVGALPSEAEVEPNNDFEQPQLMNLGSTMHGVVNGEDVDYYAVACKKGQRLSVEVEGLRLGNTFWDPYVEILNPRRFAVASSDDSPLCAQDSGCSVIIESDETYLITIRESAYGGNGAAYYRLHVGDFPRPTAIVPAGGKPGETLNVRFIGDRKGDVNQKIVVPTNPGNDFRIHREESKAISPTGFPFRVIDIPNVLENDQNTNPDKAVVGPVPAAFNGIVSKNGERDYYKFAAKKGQSFDVTTYARALGSPIDSYIAINEIKDGKPGRELKRSDDTGRNPDGSFRFDVPNDGEYILSIWDHLDKGGPDYFYRVEVTVPSATTALAVPKYQSNRLEDQTLSTIVVPKGNRYATIIQVNRQNWASDAKLSFDQLPPGVSMSLPDVEAGQALVPIVFEAKPDAPVQGSLRQMSVTPSDANLKIGSGVGMETMFSRGGNNDYYHTVNSDRVAMAVAEEVPFTLEIVEPKSAIPRGASGQLKVIAKRKEGFTKEIRCYPIFTPPGMGIDGQVVIPENKNEATFNMNASGNAPVRKWQTAVRGVSNAGDGNVWVSSQLFTLEVSEPILNINTDRNAVEQGNPTTMFSKVEVNTPFDGEAKVELLGLPNKATSEPQMMKPDIKELKFPVTTEKDTPAGKHKVFYRVTLQRSGETYSQNLGYAELRVDKPLPPKPNAPPKKVEAAPPKPAAAPMEKPLSRLEQLRLEQEQKEKEAREGKK